MHNILHTLKVKCIINKELLIVYSLMKLITKTLVSYAFLDIILQYFSVINSYYALALIRNIFYKVLTFVIYTLCVRVFKLNYC